MMKIWGAGETRPPARARKSAKSTAAFSAGTVSAGNAAPASNIGVVSSPSTLTALIALQTRDGGNKKTYVAAQRILDLLDDLRLRLLNGGAKEADMAALRAAAQLRAHAQAEPELLALYDEITLRARVELAKLGKRGRGATENQ